MNILQLKRHINQLVGGYWQKIKLFIGYPQQGKIC